MAERPHSAVLVELRGYGRDFETNDARWNSWDHKLIHEASTVFARRSFETGDGSWTVDVDWSAILNYQTKLFELDSLPVAQRWQKLENEPDFFRSKPTLIFKYPPNASREVESSAHWFLGCIFLTCNIAVPGSFDLFRASCNGGPDDISYSAGIFEMASLDTQKHDFLNIAALDCRVVSSWIDRLIRYPRFVAGNRLERVLFGLLYLCRIDLPSPASITWLAYCLESIFDTPAGGASFQVLAQRICMFLDVPRSKTRMVKRRLREFYDVRSAFVHGRLPVLHPDADERVDPK